MVSPWKFTTEGSWINCYKNFHSITSADMICITRCLHITLKLLVQYQIIYQCHHWKVALCISIKTVCQRAHKNQSISSWSNLKPSASTFLPFQWAFPFFYEIIIILDRSLCWNHPQQVKCCVKISAKLLESRNCDKIDPVSNNMRRIKLEIETTRYSHNKGGEGRLFPKLKFKTMQNCNQSSTLTTV